MAGTAAAARSDVKLNDSSDDDNFDEEGYDNDPEITLRSIEKSRTINFSISATYTKWEPREAFRELVQNWRDGIIKSFNLQERDFRVTRQDNASGRNTEIIYKVLHADANGEERCLGYIRYKGRDGEGTVEMVNCCATLQPWHLDMGSTSKEGDEHQAGAHGEGLKVALLVLMRGKQNHHVRCRSGGFNWTFNFTTRGRLVARLRRMSREAIFQAEMQAERLTKRTLLPFAVRPDGDVQFVIGEGRRGRNERGESVKRSCVTQQQFDAWTKAALFLHNAGEGAIIETPGGGLTVAPQLHGNIYLKGLLLQESTALRSASMTGQPLRFGYNFASGQTDRDRKSVTTQNEEAKAILAIWDAVLIVRPDMVSELSDMLNTTEPQYADVAGAKRYMTKETAILLKTYLRGGEFARNWYYCDEEKSKNPRLDHIILGLGCEGVELTKTYWDILRKYSLVRTAEEEEHRRFTAAPSAAVPETDFATSLCHLLRACFRACPQTDDLDFAFVLAGQLDLQLSFSDDDLLFRIHDRWLSIGGAIAEVGLLGPQTDADILCHAAKSLFSDALEQLPLEAFFNKENLTKTPERQRKLEVSYAEQRLRGYQRIKNPVVEPVTGRPELRVRWLVDRQRDADTEIEIQCHRASTCYHLRENLQIEYDARPDRFPCIAPEGIDPNDHDPNVFTCRASRQSSWTGEHVERDLEGGEEYFFLLAMTPTDAGAFVSHSSARRCSTRRSPSAPPHHPPSSPATPLQLADDEHDVIMPVRTAAGPSRSAQQNSTRPSRPNGDGLPQVPANASRASSFAAAREPVAVASSSSTMARATTPASDLFGIGPELRSLDICNIERWNAVTRFGFIDEQLVVGVVKEEKFIVREETRKRRRREEEREQTAESFVEVDE